jgi:catechol 2,3-dioxygenase-like lactoylglutathione lyase family enzyme
MENMTYGAKTLAHIGIFCQNYNKSAEFYQRLGFKPYNTQNEKAGFYSCGDCIIELYQIADKNGSCSGPLNHFALTTDDIEASFEEAKRMNLVIVSNGIESNDMFAPKSNRYFIFLGPDGERIEFAQIQ